MVESKAWNWEEEKNRYWLKPCEESYYLAQKWQESGAHRILDLGSGLGRHAIYFSRQGFEVSACDLSGYGIDHLNTWAEREACASKPPLRTCFASPMGTQALTASFPTT